MAKEQVIINANFKIDKDLWKVFKDISKIENSDASKELRKLIIIYIKNNENLMKN